MKYVALCKNGDAIFGELETRRGTVATMKNATRVQSFLGAESFAEMAMEYISESNEQIRAVHFEQVEIKNLQLLIPCSKRAAKNIERFIGKEKDA